MKRRLGKTRTALFLWTLFIGLGAVAGATGLLGVNAQSVTSVCCRRKTYLSRKLHSE